MKNEGMISLLYKLYQVNLLSPSGLFILLRSLQTHGANLMAMLHFSAQLYPERLAIQEGSNKITYRALYESSYHLASKFHQELGVNQSKKIALLCQNHTITIQTIFAISRLGADLVLLNIEMSEQQINKILDQNEFDLLIYDNHLIEKLKANKLLSIPCFEGLPNSIERYIKYPSLSNLYLKRYQSGNLSVLTGGTSGRIKFAKRKPSIRSMIMPFLTLLDQLNLHQFNSVYISVPFYHGYGLASLTVAIILSAKVFVHQKFETKKALKIIESNQIAIAILVPTMLQRMLDANKNSLLSLKGILSGGAPLDKNLVEQVFQDIGPILFNLYGTSETGFSVLATPSDLQKYPETIGKKIKGVALKLLDETGKEVDTNKIGTFCIKSAWAMTSTQQKYYATGDLGYKNEESYLFLKGRADDMIVSGGENVYPRDLELILLEHPQIKAVTVLGIDDNDFGKRLHGFIILEKKSKPIKEDELKKWLQTKVARYQMPDRIYFLETLPITSTGKINKNKLIEFVHEQ